MCLNTLMNESDLNVAIFFHFQIFLGTFVVHGVAIVDKVGVFADTIRQAQP